MLQLCFGKNGVIFYTFLGKTLRFTHLDETPQLWNILRGDISFIGPRPERAELAQNFRELPYYHLRHIIKPGLTGWAQVNGRDELDLTEKVNLDAQYLERCSTGFDFYILLLTVLKVFKREGVSH